METVVFCQGTELPDMYQKLLGKGLLHRYYRMQENKPLLARPYLKKWEIELEAKSKTKNH